MNAAQVIEKLRQEYPGRRIICVPEDNPSEIICEVNPSSRHPEFSRAVVAIKTSAPHYHNLAKETYRVTEGSLDLFVGGQHIKLNEGDEYVVLPKSVHRAKGNFTIVQVDSTPGWTPGDHILAES